MRSSLVLLLILFVVSFHQQCFALDSTDSAKNHFNQALNNMRTGQLDAALEQCNKAIECEKSFFPAYDLKASIYTIKGDNEKVVQATTQCIEVNPKVAKCYALRGKALCTTGKVDQGMADFDKAIAIDPTYGGSYFRRGQIYQFVLHQMDKAIADLSKAVELQPKVAETFLARAAAYLEMSDDKKAIEDCDKAVLIDPKDPQPYFVRGSVYKLLGKTDLAEQDFKTVSQLRSGLR